MSKNIKTSQFGGVGGGYSGSPYQPGGSPLGRGGSKGVAYDINSIWGDENTLEKLISRTHPDADYSDRNMESRLTPQHEYQEENKNYYLDAKERLRARFREELHKHKRLLEDHANSLHENSVEYIKNNFPPQKEHMMTIEEKLKSRRTYSDNPKQNYFKYEDEIPDLVQPERILPVISSNNKQQKTADMISRPNQITDELASEENWVDNERYRNAPMGNFQILTKQIDLPNYLYEGDGANVSYQQEDGLWLEDTILGTPDSETLPVFSNSAKGTVTIKNDGDNNLFKPLKGNTESQLNPTFPLTRFDRNQPSSRIDVALNTVTEDMGLEDEYQGSTHIGLFSPSPWS
jgi:hypothetical protein